MLTHTFRHIPGIGLKTEKKLWKAGFRSWEDLKKNHPPWLAPDKIATIREYLNESERHLANNPLYFYKLLNSNQHWRIFPHFRQNTVYLDIETTGLSESQDHITTICTYDGAEIKHYVYGQNLDHFIDDIARYDVLATYNGKIFDIPFIERFFGREITKTHIDLRYLLRNLGFSGGLKNCEKQIGLDRGTLDGVDGYLAVLLWQEYKKSSSPKALETLLAYNIEDAVNLESLMVEAYNLSVKATPFAEELTMKAPNKPLVPFVADLMVIDKIKRTYPL